MNDTWYFATEGWNPRTMTTFTNWRGEGGKVGQAGRAGGPAGAVTPLHLLVDKKPLYQIHV
jgi:hypothetical protein